MNRKHRLLRPELVSKSVPLQLGLHLELLVEDRHAGLRGNGFDPCVDFLLVSLPADDNVMWLVDCYGGLTDIKVDGDLLLIEVLTHL